MKTELLIEYFEKCKLLNETENEEVYGNRLDEIWYKEFTQYDIDLTGIILRNEYAKNPRIDVNQNLQNIINNLKEKKNMSNIFETKEDYLKFRDFWKKFHADKRYAKIPESYDRYDHEIKDIVVAGIHMKSPLTNIHHMIYLSARGKSLDKAFKNIKISTINELRNNVLWALGRYKIDQNFNGYYFELFGDAIDFKYRKTILEIIATHLNQSLALYNTLRK